MLSFMQGSLRKSIQRELIRVSNTIIEKAYDETSDVFDLLDEAESKLFESPKETFGRATKAWGLS